MGDEVIVEFTGQSQATPKVIGFRDHPKRCGWKIKFTGSYFAVNPDLSVYFEGSVTVTPDNLKARYPDEQFYIKIFDINSGLTAGFVGFDADYPPTEPESSYFDRDSSSWIISGPSPEFLAACPDGFGIEIFYFGRAWRVPDGVDGEPSSEMKYKVGSYSFSRAREVIVSGGWEW